MEVPHFDLHIDEDSLLAGAKKILQVLRSDWDVSSTQFKVFTDGITNKLLGCFNAYHLNDVILIRVYGNKTDMLIDRKAETKNIKILHLAGLAPKLYGTFNNGLVYEYVPGEVLSCETCRLDHVSVLVAKKLADMHSVKSDSHVKDPALWKHIKNFLTLVPSEFSEENKAEKFTELFPEKLKLEKEYSFLEQELSNLGSPIVFCHNDLLLGNIVYNIHTNAVTFIDYEYAAYNYQAYDIANHFNEYAGVENVDYTLFPDETYQKRWLKVYLEQYKIYLEDCEETDINEEDVNLLYLTVQKYTLASHFLWGIWSLVQAEYSSINFDFLNYASHRFQEYYNKKKKLFPL